MFNEQRNFGSSNMKRNIHYILYLIAFIVIIIPVIIKEAAGASALEHSAELCLLVIGVILLIAGKVFSIRKKRQIPGEHIYMDIVIIIGLIVMLAWILINELR